MRKDTLSLINSFNNLLSFDEVVNFNLPQNEKMVDIHIEIISDRKIDALFKATKAFASIFSINLTFSYIDTNLINGNNQKKAAKSLYFIFTEELTSSKKLYTEGKNISSKSVLKEIGITIDKIEKYEENPFILITTLPSYSFPNGGIQNLKNETNTELLLLKTNYELIEKHANSQHIYIVDNHRFTTTLSSQLFNEELWHRIPYKKHIKYLYNLQFNSKWLLHFIYPLLFQRIKAFALDLDDTLWNGTVAEVGISQIKMDYSKEGFSHLKLQNCLNDFKSQGILIGFISRNDNTHIKSVIEKLVEENQLCITPSTINADNYSEKSELIKLMCKTFDNISPSSVIFIDNSDIEREAVKGSEENVIVAPFPYDISLFEEMLIELPFIEKISINSADLERIIWYEEKNKNKLSFEIEMHVNSKDDEHINRITELINKTNQFNFTTQRLSKSDVIELSLSPSFDVIAFEAVPSEDSNVSSSIFSVVIIDKSDNNKWAIVNFIMSCRYMGLNFDNLIFEKIVNIAKEQNVEYIIGEYSQTDRNTLVKDWYLNKKFVLYKKDKKSFLYRAFLNDLLRLDKSNNSINDFSIFLSRLKVFSNPFIVKSRMRNIDGAEEVFITGGELKAGITKEMAEQLSKTFGIYPEVELNQGIHKIKPFWIDKYCITNHQYALFLNSAFTKNKRIQIIDEIKKQQTEFSLICSSKGVVNVNNESRNNQPVIIPYTYALMYAEWVNGRLPTEYEWEWAAKGSDERIFPWGIDLPDYRSVWLNIEEPAEVNYLSKVTSPFGIVGMVGNVWQWCSTEFRNHPQYKGGDYRLDSAYWKRITLRPLEAAEYCGNIVGFRVVRNS